MTPVDRINWLSGVSTDHRIGATAVRVAAYLVGRYNGKTGQLNPSQESISIDTGVSRRGVQYAIAELVECGWMSIVTEGLGAKKTASYALNKGAIIAPIGGEKGAKIDTDSEQKRRKKRQKKAQKKTEKGAKIDNPPTPPYKEEQGKEQGKEQGNAREALALVAIRSDSDGGSADRVFDHWKSVMNHPRSRLDAKRRKLIRSRLADGFCEADLRKAIDGCAGSAFHMGQNKQRTRYDGLGLILRDAEKIDRFIAMAESKVDDDQSLDDWLNDGNVIEGEFHAAV